MKKLLSITLLFGALAGIAQGALAQDAKAGQKKIAMCIGCHGIPGYQASFPEIHKVPMIAGQNAKYIIAALTEYQKGERKHPTMRAIAASLSDQDMADIAAFYAQQGQADAPALAAKPDVLPSAAVAELLKRGNCVSCHGENFAKPIDAQQPAGRTRQRGHGRHDRHLHPPGVEAAGAVHRLAAGRPEDRAGVALPLTRQRLASAQR